MARILTEIIGHSEEKKKFLDAMTRDHLGQTHLFVGPSGVGRKKFALGLAQALICKVNVIGCGSCYDCLHVEKNQHEGLKIITPEKNIIRIEQARSILEYLSLQSISRHRVIIIDHAELMNQAAANSLLKILEEAPNGVYFFMIAPSASHVLPTIRSRAMVTRFQPMTFEQLKKKLDSPDWVLRASLGSFERMSEYSNKESLALREKSKQFLLTALRNPRGYTQSDVKEWIRDRNQALGLAQFIALFFRDAVFWQLGEKSNLINVGEENLFQALADKFANRLQNISKNSLELERGLLQNRDSTLLYEQFWIENLIC